MVEFPKPPEIFKKGNGAEATKSIASEERGVEGPTGPYGAPRPMEKAPHEDVGQLIHDFVGDLQGAGETICDVLDKPFEAVKIKGPHRLIDGLMDTQSGLLRNVVKHVTRF